MLRIPKNKEVIYLVWMILLLWGSLLPKIWLYSYPQTVESRGPFSSSLDPNFGSPDFENPIIPENLRANVMNTLRGFGAGFIPLDEPQNGFHFALRSQDLSIGFGESTISLLVQNPTKIEDNQITPVGINFLGANAVKPVGTIPTGSRVNYFIGSDPTQWVIDRPVFASVVYPNLYPNIDLVYSLLDGVLKYEFLAYPGSNIEDIQIQWEGPVILALDETGMQITVNTATGSVDLLDSTPINFQGLARRQTVGGRFELIDSQTYGFSLYSYDPTDLMIIDPTLEMSTFLGGIGTDNGYSIAVDAIGDIFVTGRTLSADFPITPNNYDNVLAGTMDVFVTKIAANGSTLLFSTFIGGVGADLGRDIAVDNFGNVFITGYTANTLSPATNFPTTPGAYNTSHNGLFLDNNDVFVTKLAANGSTLLYSTLIGGQVDDYAQSIAIDTQGNAYIAGETSDGAGYNFPTTPGAYNTSHNGIILDVFVAKLSADGSTLLASTFIGSGGNDYLNSMTIDGSGNIFITGHSSDSAVDFPTTPGAINTTHNGGSTGLWDVYVSKIASNFSTLEFSTFLGGTGEDSGTSIAVDQLGDVYICGWTENDATDFPTTPGAINSTHGGLDDVFVSKISADGSTLIYSTFLSSTGTDTGRSLAVDATGIVFITGETHSTGTGFPITSDAYNSTTNGGIDVFVSQLAANGSTLLYSSFLGGSLDDYGTAITADNQGNAYITGFTADGAPDFPTTSNVVNETHNGGYDLFIARISGFRVVPGVPLGLSHTITTSYGINLSWTVPFDGNLPPVTYFIYRGTESGVHAFLGSTTSEFFLDTSAVLYQPYYYVVTAKNRVGESNYSNEVNVKMLTVPDVPQNLIATPGENFVVLTWSAPSIDGGTVITSYSIYRGTTSGQHTLLGSSPSPGYNDTTAIGGQTYYYVVTTINSIGESGYSVEVSATPTSTTTQTTNTSTTPLPTTSQSTTPGLSSFSSFGILWALVLIISSVKFRRNKRH